MRIIDLEQGSEEWLKWRKSIITATDAPSIMGVSPYQTEFQCYQRKIGEIKEQISNRAMERGRELEPIIRDWFNEKHNTNMVPQCVQSDVYEYLGASLDGIDESGSRILEIKTNSKGIHDDIKKYGQIPDHHYAQIQHQLMCLDNIDARAFYVSYNRDDFCVIQIYQDIICQIKYLDKFKDFWRRVCLFDPPKLSNYDYVDMSYNELWNITSENYKKVCETINTLEKIKEGYKNNLIEITENNSCMGNGIKILKKSTGGRVDYKEVFRSYNISEEDLKKFRSESKDSWTILIDEK